MKDRNQAALAACRSGTRGEAARVARRKPSVNRRSREERKREGEREMKEPKQEKKDESLWLFSRVRVREREREDRRWNERTATSDRRATNSPAAAAPGISSCLRLSFTLSLHRSPSISPSLLERWKEMVRERERETGEKKETETREERSRRSASS